MTAPLAELRRAYPEAEIHVAAMTAWAPLLEGHPGADRIWTYERHRETAARAKALARIGISLRRERFDMVVNFHASPSSATLAYATGARVRSVHFHGHKDKNRFSTVTIPGKGVVKPIIERDMDAVRALGIHVPAGRLPEIFLHDSEKSAARRALESQGLRGPVLGIGLGASRPTKSWPLERFAAVAVAWAQKTGGSALAVGATLELPIFNEYFKKLDEELNALALPADARAALRARLGCEIGSPVRKLAATISQLQAFVGNDSGPRHIAVSVGTPTVTLFGPEDPREWHPYPTDRHPYLFTENLACRRDADPGQPPWCGLYVCTEENHRCMETLGVNSVLERCEKLLKAGAA